MGQQSATYPISVQNINVSFGSVKALKNISLCMERGRFYGILGPNGSGKTTLLKSIAKNLKPQRGTVFVNGADVDKMKAKELAKELAYMYQNTDTQCDYSVTDVVLMGRNPYLRRFQTEGPMDREIAMKAMKATNVWQLKDRRINEISGGERQRAFVARALVQDTDIVLLDEPVSHLDLQHQIEVLDIARKMAGKQRTVVAVLHDLNLASTYCDYLILLKEGAIIAKGEPDKVLTEEIIEEVYGIKPYIVRGVNNNRPYIIPFKK